MLYFGTIVIYAMVATYVFVIFGLPTLLLVGISGALSGRPITNVATTVIAKVPQGNLIGQVTPQAAVFRGIPFSQPPIGDYRWKKPREPLAFPNGTWNATFFRPGCPQQCTYKSKEYSCPSETNEDCLYLNIWVPHSALSEAKGDCEATGKECVRSIPEPEKRQAYFEELPVIVYLHGGNFMTGAGSALLYESRFLAEQGRVIIVTTNFRLGPLGFLVQGDGHDSAIGNYGIWDQIKALEWVRDNILYFGGDSSKVTLLGQSSGAESVAVLLASAHSKSLFQRAGLLSNPFSIPYRSLQNAKEFGNNLASKVGCESGDIVCLRKTAAQDIIKAADDASGNLLQPGKKLLAIQPWGPIIDGDLLSKMPLKSFINGEVSSMPLIMGTTTGEGMFFIGKRFETRLSTIFYNFVVASLLGEKTSAVLGNYPSNCSVQCDNRGVLSDIVTDYIFTCPTRTALLSQKSFNENQWFYVFDQVLPFTEFWDSPLCGDVSCHCADLPYLFNNLELTHLRFNEKEQLLARRIGRYWTNFAKHGNPNGQDFESDFREFFTTGPYHAEYWPRFGEVGYGSYSALKLENDGDSIWVEPYNKICDFWDNMDSYGDLKR